MEKLLDEENDEGELGEPLSEDDGDEAGLWELVADEDGADELDEEPLDWGE